MCLSDVCTLSMTQVVCCLCDWLTGTHGIQLSQSQTADSSGHCNSTYVAQTTNIVSPVNVIVYLHCALQSNGHDYLVDWPLLLLSIHSKVITEVPLLTPASSSVPASQLCWRLEKCEEVSSILCLHRGGKKRGLQIMLLGRQKSCQIVPICLSPLKDFQQMEEDKKFHENCHFIFNSDT